MFRCVATVALCLTTLLARPVTSMELGHPEAAQAWGVSERSVTARPAGLILGLEAN